VAAQNPEHRLDSWKEIADYVGKDVRTVIRWEKEKGLPVRRLPGGKRQSVFAIAREIDAWAARDNSGFGSVTHTAEAAPAERDQADPNLSAIFPGWLVKAAGFSAILLMALSLWFFLPRSLKRAGSIPSVAPPRAEEVSFGVGSPRYVRLPLETGVRPYIFAAADFNGDGNMDLVFSANPGSGVGVLLGNGDGTFLPARMIEGCPQSNGLGVADFNHDGIPDLAVACLAADSVMILWGQSGATFSQRSEIHVPGGPRFVATGDLNGDGWPDLAVGTSSEPALYFMPNRSGKFAPILITRLEAVYPLTVDDTDGDGRPELVASIRDRSTFGIAIFRSAKDGTLKRSQFLSWDRAVYATGARTFYLGESKFPDLAYSLENCEVWLRRGVGGGEFSEPRNLAGTCRSGGDSYFVVADLDLDGIPDLLVTDYAGRALTMFAGKRNGEFELRGSLVVGDRPFSPIVADFNNDHVPDIVVNAYFERASLLKATWRPKARD